MAGDEEQEGGGSVKAHAPLRLPHARLRGFMGDRFAQELAQTVCADPASLTRALVTSPEEKRALDPDSRRSWEVTGAARLLERFEARIRRDLDSLCEAVGLEAPESPHSECILYAHRDGDFFRPHVDVFTEEKRVHARYDRMLTAVYYAHREPVGFSGGELVLHPPFGIGKSVAIAPENDTLVLFPSFTPHEVRTVHVPGDALEDARFSINCWVGRRR